MMLGYFPDPYPDELFYSLCARFSESMRYPTRDAPIRELLGLKGVGTLAILPTGLDQLVANLPPFACYTAEQFINEHTLYPYYAPFLPSDRLPRLQQVMRGDTSKPSPLVLVGMPSHRIPLRQWLRYCPVCAEEDRRSFGERYWHRLHQVTGVEVCPVHRVFLQNSSVQPYEAYRRYQIHSAEEAIQLTQPKTVDSFNTLHQKLLQIASDTAWLLDQHGLAFGLEGLRTRYRNRLYKEGLATYYGKLRLHQLVSRFRSHYPPELLAMVSSSFAESNHQNWLTTFLRGHSEGQPPIWHLLVMNFLGYTAEQFFSLPQEDPPFGKGPWPCLNPTCEFFRQLVIPKYHLITCHEGRPRANFACVCGFTYSRIGPDQTVEDMYRWSRVWTYGPIWEGTLRRGWQDDTLSFRQLARQLHIHETTLPHYAASLGLSYPRPGGGPILPDVEGKRKRWNTVEQMIAKRDTTRTALIAALEEHPEWGREDLQKKMPGVYKWLLIHDSEWLQRYGHGRVPAIRKGGLVSREYWQQRDSNLAEEVKASAQHLRAAPGRPFRITRQAIAAEIHQVGLLAHQLDKLPLTSKVLAEVAETREAAAIRRLQWVAERYRQEEKHPNRWQLIQQAGADNLISQPLVKEEVEKLLFMLNS